MAAAEASLIAVSVGNTRTQIGQFVDGELARSERFANADFGPMIEVITAWWREIADSAAGGGGGAGAAAMLLASVNEPLSARLASALKDQLAVDPYRLGDDVPVPIGTQLDPETLTGIDRLLNAAAAYHRLKQACVVVDAGTAVTVDFIDGEGTFHGGAIAPGAAMQLHALHERTAALPELGFRPPDAEPFGRNTTQAMLQGVYHGIRGLVHSLVEQYAEHYGAFPLVIATGGDAQALFGNDPLIDRIVPELTLLGIAVAARHALADEEGVMGRGS